MKAFIITIDTEGDNLWNWKPGRVISTDNVDYIERFQKLSEYYGFKPTWLSNWEMLNDDRFVNFAMHYEGKCEIGMHLHAWNNPPEFCLPSHEKSGLPYLIEYSDSIMEEKIGKITSIFYERFGMQPLSHRAGRWAMNDSYYRLLYKFGYRYDCSITPGISWRKSIGQTKGFWGPDYRGEQNTIRKIHGILEIPLNTRCMHSVRLNNDDSFICNVKNVLKGISGQRIYIRPGQFNTDAILKMIDLDMNNDYYMFMLHSSELMPGGSPAFPDEKSIEKLYMDIEAIFKKVAQQCIGMTLSEYGKGKYQIQ